DGPLTITGIATTDWPARAGHRHILGMRPRYITLGLLLAACAILATAPRVTPGALCPPLALQAAPGRLVSQVQTGLAALLDCAR
ncbi:MAG: hypothetical protein WCP77_20580, partial [Roseococcus sp.]